MSRLHIHEEGRGRPIVFLHGVGLRHEAWEMQYRHFSKTYRVLALDLPGHGRSSLADEGFDVFLEAIANAIDGSLQGERYVLVGHSLGALLALSLAQQSPRNLAGLVCANAVYQRSEDAKALVRERAAQLAEGKADAAAPLERWFGDQYPELRQRVKRWLEAGGEGYQQAYHYFANYEDLPRNVLSQIETPALFVTGAFDQNSTPQMSIALAEALPQGRSRIIDDAAHMMPMTHPDEFNDVLETFLTEVKFV